MFIPDQLVDNVLQSRHGARSHKYISIFDDNGLQSGKLPANLDALSRLVHDLNQNVRVGDENIATVQDTEFYGCRTPSKKSGPDAETWELTQQLFGRVETLRLVQGPRSQDENRYRAYLCNVSGKCRGLYKGGSGSLLLTADNFLDDGQEVSRADVGVLSNENVVAGANMMEGFRL